MGKHAKTLAMLQVAKEVLEATHPMTVRQVYYQLVSRQVIENNRSQSKRFPTCWWTPERGRSSLGVD